MPNNHMGGSALFGAPLMRGRDLELPGPNVLRGVSAS